MQLFTFFFSLPDLSRLKLKNNDNVSGITLLYFLLLLPSTGVVSASDIAIEGYDTVAYFTLQKATPGDKNFNHIWNGRTWYFSNAEHRNMFIENPQKYAPQFNGFCANGLSDGHAVEASPKNWRIIDNKLYLFFSERGRNKWEGNVKPLIDRATETYSTQ